MMTIMTFRSLLTAGLRVRPRGGDRTSRRADTSAASASSATNLPGCSSAAGFTLLELIVVMVLIGLLVGIALPAYRDATQRAKEAALRENLVRLREAIDEYHTDKGEYPPALEDVVTAGYLRAMPVDPITESESSWDIEYAPWEMVEEGDIAGVFNVHSGATGNALDGTPYKEW